MNVMHAVAVVEHRERHDRVLGGALDDQERDEEDHGGDARTDHPRVDPAAGGPWVNTSTADVQPSVASSAPVTSSFSRS